MWTPPNQISGDRGMHTHWAFSSPPVKETQKSNKACDEKLDENFGKSQIFISLSVPVFYLWENRRKKFFTFWKLKQANWRLMVRMVCRKDYRTYFTEETQKQRTTEWTVVMSNKHNRVPSSTDAHMSSCTWFCHLVQLQHGATPQSTYKDQTVLFFKKSI